MLNSFPILGLIFVPIHRIKLEGFTPGVTWAEDVGEITLLFLRYVRVLPLVCPLSCFVHGLWVLSLCQHSHVRFTFCVSRQGSTPAYLWVKYITGYIATRAVVSYFILFSPVRAPSSFCEHCLVLYMDYFCHFDICVGCCFPYGPRWMKPANIGHALQTKLRLVYKDMFYIRKMCI